jgi:hypothetical protein
MKKILALVLVLLCFALVACKGEEKPNVNGDIQGGETNSPETDTPKAELPKDVNPDDYFKFVTFELPEGSLREAAVNYMREQANVVWTPSKTFTYGNTYENWAYKLTYEAGKKYHGLPYTHLSASIGEFTKLLNENGGKYSSDSDSGNEVMGAQCNSSICHSFQQFTPIVCMTSRQYMPSYKDEFVGKICGNYNVPEGVQRTLDIIQANTQDAIYEAYAMADMGDVIMSNDDTKGVVHDRMVAKKPVIVKAANGKINPNRSYLVTVEQTDTFDDTRKDGVNTTWWIDHQYTFSKLYETNYIPITFEVYETNVGVIPYITLDKEPNASALSKGVIDGTVTSNYPVRYVHVSILDENGNLVSREMQRNNYDVFKVNIKKFSVKLFGDLKAGNYTLLIEAGICRGDAELYRNTFTYNG